MTQTTSETHAGTTLARGRLGVVDIVFFVVSAAAPLTVTVSAAPSSIHFGGIGGPAGMVFAGLVLLLFAAGFTAMSKYVRNAGAFYAYAARGLGKPAGVGVAMVTVFAYVVLTVSFYGYIGFFGSLTLDSIAGLTIPWWVISLSSLAIVGFLGRRQVEVGARTLGVLLTLEVGLLLVLSAAVLITGGPEPASLAPFNPQNLFFVPGVAALIVMGFGAYVGFEGTAIYAEEAKDPERTVPRATYIAISLLAVLYGFTFWIVIYAFGVDGVIALAAGDDFPELVMVAGSQYLGDWAGTTIQILIVTSFFACLLAFHNAASRYLFSLGREGLLPKRLGTTGESGAPAAASLVMTVVCGAAIVGAIVFSLDPYLQLGLWTYGAGVAGLVFAQAATSVAVLGFFFKDRRGESVWRVLIAPGLGAIGLISAFILIIFNFEIVSGLTGWVNWALLAPTPILFIAGIVIGLVLKARSPQRYAALVSHTEEELSRQ